MTLLSFSAYILYHSEKFFLFEASDGVHGWAGPNDVTGLNLPTNQLTVYTIWFDGTTCKIYWGSEMKQEFTQSGWDQGALGYVVMGLGMQNNGHDYSGYIGEVLAYTVALPESEMLSHIQDMETKWSPGKGQIICAK